MKDKAMNGRDEGDWNNLWARISVAESGGGGGEGGRTAATEGHPSAPAGVCSGPSPSSSSSVLRFHPIHLPLVPVPPQLIPRSMEGKTEERRRTEEKEEGNCAEG